MFFIIQDPDSNMFVPRLYYLELPQSVFFSICGVKNALLSHSRIVFRFFLFFLILHGRLYTA